MFQNNTVFNQNLGGWSVTQVISYNNFSDGATAYVLAKPNFTNCTP